MGWHWNGKLLSRASRRYDAFVTMDRSIEHEQNVSRFPFGVLVLRAPSNRLVHLRPLVRAILDALTALAPGQLRHVGPNEECIRQAVRPRFRHTWHGASVGFRTPGQRS